MTDSALDHVATNASSYVHTLETPCSAFTIANDTKENAYNLGISYRHSATQGRRTRIRRAIEQMEANEDRLDRWDHCGAYATIERSVETPSKLRVNCTRCHDRFCPACGTERSRRISHNVVNAMNGQVHRFLTLTVKHTNEPLGQLLDKLQRGFGKLRKSKLWRTTTTGGAAFVEVKKANGWHPHIHAIMQGNWIDAKELSREWLRATGDSSIVKLKMIRDPQKVAYYVAKYASKPLDTTVVNDTDALQEALTTLRGRKMIMTFGTWRTRSLTTSETDEVWETVGTLQQMMDLENQGDPGAIEIMNALRRTIECRRNENAEAESVPDG